MPQLPPEVELARRFASALGTAVFIVDPDGNLLYYNRPAEEVLGMQFDKKGEMPASEWSRIFTPTDEGGLPLLPDDLPLMIAVREQHAAHRDMWIRGIDNVSRHIEVTALPLRNEGGIFLGAVAVFWDVKQA